MCNDRMCSPSSPPPPVLSRYIKIFVIFFFREILISRGEKYVSPPFGNVLQRIKFSEPYFLLRLSAELKRVFEKGDFLLFLFFP